MPVPTRTSLPTTAPAPAPRLAGPAREPVAPPLVRDGPYARLGRPALRAGLLLLCLPPALALAVPIALLGALAFRDWRAVLFLQERVGLHGRVFRIVKFRTLREPDGARTNGAYTDGAYTDAPEERDQARVTRFGRFLRRTHLDELPQIWNVLRGEMDFVGPRPETLAIDEWARRNVPGFRARNAVLPGITGLAQVTQGYAPPEARAYRRKLALDRLYLARRSAALDAAILLRTLPWMLRGRGWRARSRRHGGPPAPAH